MPECWTQFGAEFSKNFYIDDPTPSAVIEVDKMLSSLIVQAHEMGVGIKVLIGDKPFMLKSCERRYSFYPLVAKER